MNRRLFQIAALVALVTSVAAIPWVTAQTPVDHAFERTWSRTDKAVAEQAVDRTWMWGPRETAIRKVEPYDGAPGGQRVVTYYDKSRMEDNAYRGTNPWDVTNGLLVVELISGEMQTGDSSFDTREPADINVAGDPDQSNPITYALMAGLLDDAATPVGTAITARATTNATSITLSNDPSLAARGVTAAEYVPATRHTVASPFWAFMNSSGVVYENGGYTTENLFESAFYATGYPITEAFWATVTVGGTDRDVLMQCFERRCLTYTPDNPEGWKVEAGNVGLHYYQWRYDDDNSPTPLPTPTPDPNALYQSNLTDWPVIADNIGNSAYPTYEDYQIRTVRGATLYSISDVTLGDGSYRVEVRNPNGGDALACVAIRATRHPVAHNLPQRSTNFCLIYTDGQARQATAFIQTINGNNTVATSELGTWPLPTPIAGDAWASLRLDAFSNELKYYVNNIQIATTGGAGAPGLLALANHSDDESQPVTVAFRDMVVRRTP